MERRPKARWERLLAGLVLVILSPIWVPLAVLVLILRFALGLLLYIAIWILWFPRGKDTLFVYSNSPIWENYMLEQVLPPVRERAIVINWSDRKRWKNWSLAVRAFHYFGGRRAFNPLVVIFRPLRSAKKFRFWSAFKEWKHGNQEPVETLRSDIFRVLRVDASGRGQ
jgi:hypothetical protein